MHGVAMQYAAANPEGNTGYVLQDHADGRM